MNIAGFIDRDLFLSANPRICFCQSTGFQSKNNIAVELANLVSCLFREFNELSNKIIPF